MPLPATEFSPSSDFHLHTLSNGLRVLVLPQAHLDSVQISVYVRTGSRHEAKGLNGISHVVEHMAFKGTHSRNCQQINLDAERLGADFNAHTDKDHTAYHLRGMSGDADRFMAMLADIVRHSSFPSEELERERQVILHELTEDEDDPLSSAYKLFDKLCFGAHPMAQPVIGTRKNIERFTREDLLNYVSRQYTASNVVIAVTGRVDPQRVCEQAQRHFEDMPTGQPNTTSAPTYLGGIGARRHAGFSQTHLVMGWPMPSSLQQPEAHLLAATLFGEGMSSPLLDEIRERRGLVYYAACSADVNDLCGQWMIEASTSPAQLDECVRETVRLLARHGESIVPVDLERARNQLRVRQVRHLERPGRRLEAAVQDVYNLGRVRSRTELSDALEGVTAEQVRAAFVSLSASPASVAIAGKVPNGARDRVAEHLAALAAPKA